MEGDGRGIQIREDLAWLTRPVVSLPSEEEMAWVVQAVLHFDKAGTSVLCTDIKVVMKVTLGRRLESF